MPQNAYFNIPFNPGLSISEQILQGLHQGFSERQQAKEMKLREQTAQRETERQNVLNRLTEAQIQHENNLNAYEQETNPIRKRQLLSEATKSALDLEMAKHQAKFFGIDLSGIESAVSQAAPAAQASPTTATTGEAPTAPAPTPFQQQMERTKGFLGTMTPDEEALWQNGVNMAQRSLSIAPLSSAMGEIVKLRGERQRAELETTPYKAWHGQFVKEHGREPSAKEIQEFTTAGQAMRIQGLENLRQDNYLDTTEPGGVMTAMTAGEFADANKKEPGRYVKATGQAINAIKATGLINDIRDGMKQMEAANAALPAKGLSSKARALLSLAAKDPEHATATVMAGLAATGLSEQEQDYLIAHATLAERAMAMRSLQGQGAGSDQQRAAIVAMLPGFATADKKMAERQLKTLANNVENVDRTIPKVGKMSRQSAAEAAGGEKTPAAQPKATHRYNPETGQIEEIKP